MVVAPVTERRADSGEYKSVSGDDSLIEEKPIALVYNGLTHAVMMLTPIELEYFAVGFSLTEGIIDDPADIFDIELITQVNGLELNIELNSRQFNRLKQRRRSLTGVSGCGLCGKESLDMVNIELPPLATEPLPSPQLIEEILQKFSNAQILNKECGSVHACGFFDARGNPIHVSEDVGRHNAMDKLIGYLAVKNVEQRQGIVMASSRASYEMVQKCLQQKLSTLISVSAATSMAMELATQGNMNLIGFARPGRHVVYHQGKCKPEV
ncbi:formate dehydrogenase accessory sulfurtransferase FdhD [Thalassotalea sp. PS06]|uniref:formate dehydrogenase accessory sulfurtransferase FdhD n=1 Tax=Thalassotalea sp. PS06 TaxID=2594005 RepID=UPI001162BE4A|nr:formate dehydrogenase accessory sulfurtransferase FdhD [Thalassotalea sp. PS06]QDO99954.1 formate dehydrogenase accessory sulfurtransferase FdhD [Thalassotalea sp. PS06]